ncbi:hypothetical protein NPIL_315291 [Nephila pilipes]|uniref:Uncharacterized protein n=1 Tax=Nephila pilipes TaxID=299642 RepID=A0A8X6PCR8_NEPPI|nr:hypothetical protein NPIL_315291 [Nephila pilipes]
MPLTSVSIQEALALLEEFSSDTESVLSDDSTDYENCFPSQFPTNPPPDNFDEADYNIRLPSPSQLSNVTRKKNNSHYRAFWSSKEVLDDNYTAKQMQIKRFSGILTHLHLNDISLQTRREEENFDELYKIYPL